jgi:hypothetical protein
MLFGTVRRPVKRHRRWCGTVEAVLAGWMPREDSNLDKRSQSPLSYR